MKNKILIVLFILTIVGVSVFNEVIKDKKPTTTSQKKPNINIEGVIDGSPNLQIDNVDICKFEKVNKFPTLKFATISTDEAKNLAKKIGINSEPIEGLIPPDIVAYLWHDSQISLAIQKNPAKITVINKGGRTKSSNKTERDLSATAFSFLEKITENKFDTISTEYLVSQTNNNNFFITSTKEGAQFVRFRYAPPGVSARIISMPSNEDLTEVILYTNGDLYSYKTYLYKIEAESKNFNLLSCPTEITRNSSSAKILSINDGQSVLYDQIDPKSFNQAKINGIELIGLVEPKTDEQTVQTLPYFLLNGRITLKGDSKSVEATIYLNAIK